ncbi:hypothetical protein Tco_0500247 [Tanacetum coccineum]
MAPNTEPPNGHTPVKRSKQDVRNGLTTAMVPGQGQHKLVHVCILTCLAIAQHLVKSNYDLPLYKPMLLTGGNAYVKARPTYSEAAHAMPWATLKKK